MLEQITLEIVFHFFLIFLRLGAAFRYFPALNFIHFLVRGRVLLVFFTTIMMMPILVPYLPKFEKDISLLVKYILTEILTGLLISITTQIYFYILHFVGQVISMQSGLSNAAFFDPSQKAQLSIFSSFLFYNAVMLVFATDTHYFFIQAIVDSYIKFPPGEVFHSYDMVYLIIHMVNDSFVLSFKMISPFIIVSITVMTGAALLSRLMPNLHIFFIITPVQILIILQVLYIVINSFLKKLITIMIYNIRALL